MVQPMAKIGGSIFAGMLVASFFASRQQLYFAAVLFLAGMIIFYTSKKRKALGALVIIAALAAGYIGVYTLAVYTPVSALDNTEAQIQGMVTEKEQLDGGTYRYTVKVENVNGDSVRNSFNMRVYSDEKWYCGYYDICKFTSTVYSASDSDTLSLDDYLRSDKVFLTASLGDDDYVSVSQNESFHFRRALLEFRDKLIDNINSNLNSPESELMVGILFGKTEGVSTQTRLQFQQAGFSHILAVSGLHLSILSYLLGSVLSFLGVSEKAQRIICITFILCFMFMAGCSPSIIRASVMAIISAGGRLMYHRSDGLNSLGAAAAVILIISPYSVMSISFLLSFSATLGILAMSKTVTDKIVNRLSVENHLLKTVIDSFNVSFCATLFTVPVTVLAFSQLVVIAPVSNLAAVPFGMMALPLGLATALTGLIPVLAPVTSMLGYAAQSVVWVLRNIAKLFSKFPAIPLGYDYVYVWLALSLALVLTAVLIKASARAKATAIASCVLMFMVGTLVSQNIENGDVTIAMLQSYYGYSTVIVQDRHAVVINCGGGSNSGTQVIQYLQSKGVGQIDAVILTNAYKSAAQGVPDLLENFKVERVIVPEAGSMRGSIIKTAENTEMVDSAGMELTGYSSRIIIDDTFSRPVLFGEIGRLSFAYGEYAWQIKQAGADKSADVVICLQENLDELVDFSFEYGIILSDSTVKLLIDGAIYENTSQLTTLRCDSTGAISVRS